MIRSNRFLGSVLLIAGTSIGAGMLGMPVASGFAGLGPTMFLLPIIWLFFLATAFFILDVNLSIPGQINMITMAEKTLGLWGKALCWVSYLLLLYSLIAVYIAGSAPIFSNALGYISGYQPPDWLSALPLLLFFGTFIYLGTKAVDYINRFFIIGLVISYLVLISFGPSQITWPNLAHRNFEAVYIGIPVLFTSFGFHIIIPTLTTYERHNVRSLRWTILIGSLFPLVVYALWLCITLGVVPLQGDDSLVAAWLQGKPITQFLSNVLHNPYISITAGFFAFFAIVTSFLGVSLSLSDFLIDGLKIKRSGKGRLLACILTFFPPLIFVLLYPRGFIMALQYAGAFVAILLGLLPAFMAWTLPKPSVYRTFLGRVLLLVVILGSCFVILLNGLDEAGFFKTLIEPYLNGKIQS